MKKKAVLLLLLLLNVIQVTKAEGENDERQEAGPANETTEGLQESSASQRLESQNAISTTPAGTAIDPSGGQALQGQPAGGLPGQGGAGVAGIDAGQPVRLGAQNEIRNHFIIHQPYLPAGWAKAPYYGPMMMPIPPPLMQVNFKLPEPTQPLLPSQTNMKSSVVVMSYPNHLPSPWNQYSVLHNYNPYGGYAFSMYQQKPFNVYSNLMQPYMSSVYGGMFDPLNLGIYPGHMPFAHMGIPTPAPHLALSPFAGMGASANVYRAPYAMAAQQGHLAPGAVFNGVPPSPFAQPDPASIAKQSELPPQGQNSPGAPLELNMSTSNKGQMINNGLAYNMFMPSAHIGPFGPYGSNTYFDYFSNANMMTAPAGPFGFNSPFSHPAFRNLEDNSYTSLKKRDDRRQTI